MSKLLTTVQRQMLVENFEILMKSNFDHEVLMSLKPVVLLQTLSGRCKWMLVAVTPKSGVGYGLCDLGMGFAEVGEVLIEELEQFSEHFGFMHKVERQRFFTAEHDLGWYVDLANKQGYL